MKHKSGLLPPSSVLCKVVAPMPPTGKGPPSAPGGPWRLVAGVMVALLLAPAARAEDWRPRIDALVKPAVESGVTIALAIGIVHEGKTHSFGYGKVAGSSDRLPDERTLFEIGSVTKVFTAIALAHTAREKLVSLDDPVRKWLPESVKVPSRDGKEITLEHLATHTSGLPRLGDRLQLQALKDPLNPYVHFSVEDLHETLSGARLASTPGTKYTYSNLGVGLLGHVLARRAGMSYEELIQRRICEPLGMSETRITLSGELKSRLAEGHDIDGKPLPPWDLGTLAGAGGLRSTVRDLLRFVQANLEPPQGPLGEAIETTHAPRYDADRPDGKIALGWQVDAKDGILWHNGQTGGYHSFVGLDRKRRIGIVVLGNTAGGAVDGIAGRIMKLVAGEKIEPLKLRPSIRVPPETLDQYVGNYELLPNFTLHVTREGDRLWVQATNQPRFGIYAQTATEFYYRAVDARITFVRDNDGRVNKLILHQHGLDLPAWKGGLVVGLGKRLLQGIRGRPGGAQRDEVRSLIRQAGNTHDDCARLEILKRLQARPGLEAGLKADVDRMVAVADRWVNGKLLSDFGPQAARGKLYDLGIAESSPLFALSCLYRARMLVWVTLESGTIINDHDLRREHLDKAVELLKVAKAAFPENRVVRMYLGEPLPSGKQYPPPAGAPRWATLQRESLERLTDIITWWIDHRMRPDGQYGGGWGDDCEMWRFWAPVLIAFEDPKIVAAQARFSSALLGQPHMRQGYTSQMTDVEHTAEDSADAITPMMHLEPDNPAWQQRARRLAELMEKLWTGRNRRGQIQFKSTYFAVDRVDDRPERACDTVYHPRAVQPALLLWQRTGDEGLGRLFSAWMDTWVDAAARAERGKPAGVIPSAIHWPDGSVGGLAPDWWDPKNHGETTLYRWPSAMAMMCDSLLLTYHMTGKEKYLEPLRSMAAIRLKWRNNPPQHPPEPGSEAWCAQKMGYLSETLAKYRVLTGSREFDELLAREGRRSLLAGSPGQRSVLEAALDESAAALRVNFEGYTSEVRYTDRVLRFPALFGSDMMFRDPIPTIKTPDPSLIYQSATGDPGNCGYFPLARVRWLTPPRQIAALVTAADPRHMSAELYHFGDGARAMKAELYLLAAGRYRLVFEPQGEPRPVPQQFVVSGPRTRITFELPPRRLCVLRIEPL